MNTLLVPLCFSIMGGWLASPDENTPGQRRGLLVRELVYQAEVFEKRQAGIDALRVLLRDERDQGMRQEIIRALAIVKHPLPRPFPDLAGNRLVDTLKQPTAVLVHDRFAWLLVRDVWLELGDWLGDSFVLDIRIGRLLLGGLDGFRQEIRLPTPKEASEMEVNAFLYRADAGDVLTFVVKRMGLNSFIPSGLGRKISGSYEVDDWLLFLERICKDVQITWVRRYDNVIFSPKNHRHGTETIKSLERKNEDLSAFLQNLAVTFDMELVLDGDLGDLKVDISLQEQPWSEVLDCLSIMNGFSWLLVQEEAGERARLIIQKE